MIFLLSLLALAADPVSARPIVNGELEDEFPAAVGLGAFNFTACSGSLITPRLVLTAAHCGADIPLELVVQAGSAYFGSSPATSFEEIGFVNMTVHPDYEELESGVMGGSLGANDMAILELAYDAETEPIWFNTETLNREFVGSEVTSVGFGITSDEDDAQSTKRSAVLTVADLDKMFIFSNNATNENAANICSGDSGGPQYWWDEDNERYLQLSVHSWGDSNCIVQSGSTRTDVTSEWILGVVEDVHGTTDVCEINGQYGDNVCDAFCDDVDPDCVEPVPEEEEVKACGCASTAPSGWLGFVALAPFLVRRRS
jgi:secreted trypsin-like serine protease